MGAWRMSCTLADMTPAERRECIGMWEERTNQDGIGDYTWFTRQRRYATDWEEA